MAAPQGAKVAAASVSVPTQGVKVPFGTVEWDSGSFFATSAPRRLRVPGSQAGRYLTQLAVRYTALSDPASPPVDPASSYYYAEILVNDQVPGNDARSTVARVPHATGTTQLARNTETATRAPDMSSRQASPRSERARTPVSRRSA